MADSIAKILGKLRFVSGGPVEWLYLDKERVHDYFINHLGEIVSFTRTHKKEGGGKAKPPFVEIGLDIGTETQIIWTLDQPITQALVFRSALKSAGSLHGLDGIGPGRFISFVGRAHISRPGMLDAEHQAGLVEYPGVYDALEARRASIEDTEKLIRGTEAPRRRQWLLTVSEGASVCAAVLDEQSLGRSFYDWIAPRDTDHYHEIFGLFRQNESGIPILATIYVQVKW
jgi:hypothetical protein